MAEAPALASILFMIIYAAAVAISLPGVAILTIVGGYLFGWLHGTVLVLIAAAAGASGVFLLTRSALGDHVRERTAPALQRFAEGFRRHALSYGFALNVVPIFPYALIIVVPAACGVPLHILGRHVPGLVARDGCVRWARRPSRGNAGPRRAAASEQLHHAGSCCR